jgi:hypothetical protein
MNDKPPRRYADVLAYCKAEIARLEEHVNKAKQDAANAHALQRQPHADISSLEARIKRLAAQQNQVSWLDRWHSRRYVSIEDALSNATIEQLLDEIRTRSTIDD